MKVIIAAAMTPSGVIGRTSKPCESIAHDPGPSLWVGGGGWSICTRCGRDGPDGRVPVGRIPCNDLPWGRAYPEDLARFKATTMGHAVVMGRKTWESLPPKQRPFPGRTNIVITSGAFPDTPDLSAFGALRLEHAVAWARDSDIEKLFVIGGARLFAEALPIADELDLTLIGREYAGDVEFPLGGSFYRLGMGLTQSIDSVRCGLGSTTRSFECVSREPSTNPDLTFTKWVRR